MDQYFIPTGVLVPGLPTEFVLDPGEEMVLSFGSVTPDTYLLAIAEGADLDPLDEPYLLFAAAPVAKRTPADINADGNADNLDITSFVAALNHDESEFYSLYPDGDYWASDCYEDGNVDNLDITRFVGIVIGGGASVPVPATGALLGVGGLALIRRGRQRSR